MTVVVLGCLCGFGSGAHVAFAEATADSENVSPWWSAIALRIRSAAGRSRTRRQGDRGCLLRDRLLQRHARSRSAADRFLSRLRTFAELADKADWAVIYYAGHGIAAGGDDFILPVDARLLSDVDIDDEAISFRRLIAATAKAGTVRLVIVDASRNNPFLGSMAREISDKVTQLALQLPIQGVASRSSFG